MNQKEMVNHIMRQLSPEKRQKLYDEIGKLLLKGMGEEEAIAKAFAKVGLQNPFQSMKIMVGQEVKFGIRKKKTIGPSR